MKFGQQQEVVVADGPPMSRTEIRELRRQESSRIALEATRARAASKRHGNINDRVEAARFKLNGQNVAQAIQTIELTSPADRDIYLLAESSGQGRVGILRAFGPVRRSVREAYLQAAGTDASPNEAP